MATDNDTTPITFYEETTGTYGDGRLLVLVDSTDLDFNEVNDDEDVLDFINDNESVSFGDLMDALRAATNGDAGPARDILFKLGEK